MLTNAPRIMIGGTKSGGGKTVVACALLRAFGNRNEKTAAFKCGPDYIDPMFHEAASGASSRNLDIFLCGKENVRNIFGENSRGKLSIIEGVMGFYDGVGTGWEASSHDLSETLQCPAVLAIEAKGRGYSLAAEVSGFKNFTPNRIAGVILNGIEKETFERYKEIIEKGAGLRVFGFLPRLLEAEIESRRLGLVAAAEIEGLKDRIDILGRATEKYIDMESLRKAALSAPPLEYSGFSEKPLGKCLIGVAKDEAFCFYYKDNLELLERLGGEIVFFSPLKDESLPPGLDGLIFGGGYPELHIGELSRNLSFMESLRAYARSGIPVIAECGGFMYLQERFAEREKICETAGVLKGESRMTEKLGPFGYVTLEALEDGLLLKKGETVNAHEFHYSKSSDPGSACIARKPGSGKSWKCVRSSPRRNIFAGYPHIHFYGNPDTARNFIKACLVYGKEKRERCLLR